MTTVNIKLQHLRTHIITKHLGICDNCKYEATITLNLKAHRVTKHEGRLALKFMYHILIICGTHSHLSDPSKIGTHIHVSHFFATLGDKVIRDILDLQAATQAWKLFNNKLPLYIPYLFD